MGPGGPTPPGICRWRHGKDSRREGANRVTCGVLAAAGIPGLAVVAHGRYVAPRLVGLSGGIRAAADRYWGYDKVSAYGQ